MSNTTTMERITSLLSKIQTKPWLFTVLKYILFLFYLYVLGTCDMLGPKKKSLTTEKITFF